MIEPVSYVHHVQVTSDGYRTPIVEVWTQQGHDKIVAIRGPNPRVVGDPDSWMAKHFGLEWKSADLVYTPLPACYYDTAHGLR